MARTATSDARKKDTREKIELGGLIVKAGLRYERRAVIFGALVELRERLKSDREERSRLTMIGAGAFSDETE
jgi:carbohydrate-selective porin OprB